MIRVVLLAAALVLVILLTVKLIDALRTRRIDWTGIAFAVGFVAIAFYLRSVTGIG